MLPFLVLCLSLSFLASAADIADLVSAFDVAVLGSCVCLHRFWFLRSPLPFSRLILFSLCPPVCIANMDHLSCPAAV
jgi:hypothetical protein